MSAILTAAWKGDNHKFVGKAFEFAYKDRLNKLLPIMGEADSRNVDYEILGLGGYGEMERYNGVLNQGEQKRGFRTVITPEEFSKSASVGYKEAKIDKLGETRKVGKRLGDSAAMTVYVHCLRMFAGAWDPKRPGGDGKSWAAADHPVASLRGEGRRYVADPASGVYSNVINESLTVGAITKAQAQAGKFITPDGLPFLCEMDTLLVGPELEATAKKLLGETARLRPVKDPDSNSNAANPIYDMNYIVVGGGRDGFTGKQWAICDRRLMKEAVQLVYITRPVVMRSELDNPLIDMFTAYTDFGMGWGDSRQIIFSQGG